jgi:hypothetical protein
MLRRLEGRRGDEAGEREGEADGMLVRVNDPDGGERLSPES